MKALLIAGIVLMGSGMVAAETDYYINPVSYSAGSTRSAYPPGCITMPVRQLDLYGSNVALVLEETKNLERVTGQPVPAKIQIFRVACSEAGRSVIVLQFNFEGSGYDVPLPDFYANVSHLTVEDIPLLHFQLKTEPNTLNQRTYQHAITQRTFGYSSNGGFVEQTGLTSWLFVLDINEPEGIWRGPELTGLYNGEWELWMNAGKGCAKLGLVPSTHAVLTPNQSLPLNGRLSGNWIEPGTLDQGFLLSISTPVPPAGERKFGGENADLLAFLAWYTFDASGQMLWLTASGTAPQGSDSVDLEIVRVEGGTFMGSKEAQRAIVGNGRLKARNCNLLEFDYDLGSLGLGSSSMNLTRILELEIAGYNCRDYPARLEGLYGPQGD